MASRTLAWLAPVLLLACVAFSPAPLAQVTQQAGAQHGAAAADPSKGAARSVRRGGASARSNLPDTTEAAQRIVASTNAFRRQQNLSVIEPNPQLARAAHYFADFMSRTDKYGHEADGNDPSARAKKFGYAYCIVAENIAYQFSSAGFATGELARRFFEGWQNSAGHRKNMLDAAVTETAVAISHSPNTGHYYAVQLFGRPASQSIEFSVANRVATAVEYVLDGQTFALPPRVTQTHKICRRSQLEFRGETRQPVNGQRLVIVNEEGGAQLKVQ